MKKMPSLKINTTTNVILIFFLSALIGLGTAGYFYYQYHKAQQEIRTIKTDPSNVQKLNQEETKKLLEEVGKLIALPEGEEPTIATITDITKLRDQPFFSKAKNGDKILIYTTAKKAILYDVVNKKILDVAPVSIGTSSAQVSSPSPSSTNQPNNNSTTP